MNERKYKIIIIILAIISLALLFSSIQFYNSQKQKEILNNVFGIDLTQGTKFKTIYYDWGIGRQGNTDYLGISAYSLCNLELEKEIPNVDWKKSDCKVSFIQKTGDFQCDDTSVIENDCFVPLNVKCDCNYDILE